MDFTDPFITMLQGRNLSDRELTRAIRQSLCAEQDAIHLYEALADATDNLLAKKVLQDIANEERVHSGEFQRLLNILLDDEQKLLDEGAQEVDEMAEEISDSIETAPHTSSPSSNNTTNIGTVGNVKEKLKKEQH